MVKLDGKKAIYRNLLTNEVVELEYDFIHVTPPMKAPSFLHNSDLVDENGFVDVDKYTLQSKKYENVFALGDASNLPTAKTGAGVRKQAPILCA